MGFTYLKSKLQIFIPTCQRTLICGSSNVVLLSYKGLSQRFTDRFLFHVNLRSLSSKIDIIQRQTLVPDLKNLRWVVLKETLGPTFLFTSRSSFVQLMRFSSNFSPSKIDGGNVLLASIALILLVYGRVETIPYSNRTHLVLSNHSLKSKLGDFKLKMMKKQYEGKTLPRDCEGSVRVRAVMEKLLEALNDGLGLENATSLKYSGDDDELVVKIGDKKLSENMMTTTRKPSKRRYGIDHLEKMKWELLVVDSKMVNAGFMPSGKVVVFSGLLDQFKDEVELATVLAHEIGHGIARHINEVSLSKWLVQFILLLLLPEKTSSVKKQILLSHVEKFFSRRNEMEADYIGLMLMASAGYDPQLAPDVYTKLSSLEALDFLSTHPGGTKRKNRLQEPEVMGQAMTVYKEVKNGWGVRSFV